MRLAHPSRIPMSPFGTKQTFRSWRGMSDSGIKWTSQTHAGMSAHDPKRTSNPAKRRCRVQYRAQEGMAAMNNRAAKFYLDAGAIRGEQQRTVKGRGGLVWPSASIRSFRFATSLDGKHRPRSGRRCPCRLAMVMRCVPGVAEVSPGCMSSCCRRRARPRLLPCMK